MCANCTYERSAAEGCGCSFQVYYHRLGTDQDEDQLFFHEPAFPKWLFGATVSDDGHTLLLSVSESCEPVNLVYYYDLTQFDGRDIGTIGQSPGHTVMSIVLERRLTSLLCSSCCCPRQARA
jgi:hypothetical protein